MIEDIDVSNRNHMAPLFFWVALRTGRRRGARVLGPLLPCHASAAATAAAGAVSASVAAAAVTCSATDGGTPMLRDGRRDRRIACGRHLGGPPARGPLLDVLLVQLREVRLASRRLHADTGMWQCWAVNGNCWGTTPENQIC